MIWDLHESDERDRGQIFAILDERDERAAAVAEPVARLVLMAIARFTNPNRDPGVWACARTARGRDPRAGRAVGVVDQLSTEQATSSACRRGKR